MTEPVVQTIGIKETKEAFVGVNELSIFLIQRLKDGVSVDDALALFAKLTGDEAFKKVMTDAFNGINQVPAELKAIDLQEGLELASLAISYVPKYVEAFKKVPATV